MKTVIIVQARMTSTRLPGKVLKTVLGKPLLEYQLERLKKVICADKVVIATTVNDTDQPIVDLCAGLGVDYFRGAEQDVLSRYYHAAKQYKAQTVVRITSDCPLIDYKITGQAIKYYLENKNSYDYVCTQKYPRGLDTEVFSYAVLEDAFHHAILPLEREHVTPYIYHTHPEKHRLAHIVSPVDYSQHRWTVDTIEDFELISRIIETCHPLNPYFTINDILKLLDKHPEWVDINAYIEQKKL